MTRRFEGAVVMLTGAAGGFGRAAAQRLAAEGAALALCDLDKAALDNLVDDLGQATPIVSQAYEITSENAVLSFIEHVENVLGPVTIGINNAGIGQILTPLHRTDAQVFDRIMAVNTRGVFLCMKHQLPRMIATRSGAIVNVASAAGLVGAGQMAAYAASKHAVVGLTRAAADEVARYGVRVNALCPAFAPTPLLEALTEAMAERHGTDRAAAQTRLVDRIPMRRMARVDEVVEAMLWLADPANAFTTGQALAVDGGLTAI